MTTETILDAWMTVIARDGWPEARIGEVALVAGATAAEVAAVAPDRWAALRGYGRMLDRVALADAGADAGSTVRDQLFTLLMARFDAAQAQRDAARTLAAAARRDPALAAFMLISLPQSIARLADAAGVATTGLLGPLRVEALSVLYLAVARVWLDDESHDLAATMKALDERLAQAERWARSLPHRLPGLEPMGAPAIPRSSDDPSAG